MPATDLCHPEKDRPLSLQEYARIQEFPDGWKFFGEMKDIYKQIGNAVPISLGYAIGKQAVKFLNGEKLDFPPKDFPFSRYTYTDDVSIRKLIEKRIKKQEEKEQLSLFDEIA